ncbi:peroxidase family protein [Planctobacterium marinum]|uniref:peroxidase family protein n=1 Tax=Planctobacterium marinum TaxID=1631968 RepID=UPI001E39C135|nr:peroxidase family protein [Planctobacterium marinum]MCC2608060.1 hypothetical protein [Planctobacterium marinum]
MLQAWKSAFHQMENNVAIVAANQKTVETPPQAPLPAFSSEQLLSLGEVCNKQDQIDSGDMELRLSAIYTYFGQFIAHDIAKFSNQNHQPSDTFFGIARAFNNIANPLNLESLYGNDNIGIDKRGKFCLFSKDGVNRYDIPRDNNGTPLLADERNDQNLLISQFTLIWMRYHNHLIQSGKSFEEAKRQTKNVYHYLIKWDFLKKIMFEDLWSLYFGDETAAPAIQLDAANSDIPAAFHSATFRFGHNMVRHFYAIGQQRGVTLSEILAKTNHGGFGRSDLRIVSDAPMNKLYRVNWHTFINDPTNKAMELSAKVKINVPQLTSREFISMSTRNLMRAHDFGVADAQTYIERYIRYYPQLKRYFSYFTAPQYWLFSGFTHTDLIPERYTLFNSTPLWFYILREGAKLRSLVRSHSSDLYGKKGILGPLGSLIVGQVFSKLLQDTNTSHSTFTSIEELAKFTKSV